MWSERQTESDVKQANIGCPPPSGCPHNRLFVPDSLHSKVINWAHTSMLICHPGVKRTMYVIKQRFWPAMERAAAEYVAACPACARNKVSFLGQMGLLHLLFLPQRPWSHISIDFMTGLPPSRGKTTILMVVDHLSKMADFV